MPKQYHLRPAVQEDASAIYRLLKRMHAEADKPLDPIDPTTSMHRIVHAIGDGLAAVLGSEKDGRRVIVGSIGLTVDTAWFSKQPFIIDLWVYVMPEYRSMEAAEMLFDFVRTTAKAHEMGRPRLGSIVDGPSEAKTRLYRRLGFEPIGALFLGE